MADGSFLGKIQSLFGNGKLTREHKKGYLQEIMKKHKAKKNGY